MYSFILLFLFEQIFLLCIYLCLNFRNIIISIDINIFCVLYLINYYYYEFNILFVPMHPCPTFITPFICISNAIKEFCGISLFFTQNTF